MTVTDPRASLTSVYQRLTFEYPLRILYHRPSTQGVENDASARAPNLTSARDLDR